MSARAAALLPGAGRNRQTSAYNPLFADYAGAWVDERPNLRPNTLQVYRYVLHRHLEPSFGKVAIGDIRDAHVRRWRKELLDRATSAASVAKAYRLSWSFTCAPYR